MKTIKYLLIFILGLVTFNSCLVDDETRYDLNDDGLNVVTFENLTSNLSILANGDEYSVKLKVKLVGPSRDKISGDISVTASIDPSSTAEEDVHFRIVNPTFTLKAADNYLGLLELTIITEGNTPPMEDTPEFEEYIAPIIVLNLAATGDPMVTGSGKEGAFTIAYTPPNPYAGDYIAHLIYRHPSYGTYPNNIYVEEDNEKTLVPVTGRKCETGFATWFDTDLCWITIKADNSIVFEVGDTWPYDVKLGDPMDASKVSHYDPATGIIYLYYYYEGSGGPRIFWETFTPVGK